MPIRPENKIRYPKNWKAIRENILKRAKNRCEGSPKYPNCDVKNHSWGGWFDGEFYEENFSDYVPEEITKFITIVLTVAHLDHTPENCDPNNLRAWCQRCHNNYDLPTRLLNRKNRLYKNSGLINFLDI